MYNNIPKVQLSYVADFANIGLIQISNANDAADLLFKQYKAGEIGHIEIFFILLLNRNNKVLGVFKVSVGGVCGTVVDPRVVFQTAILANASSVVLCHNHPSFNLTPSPQDLALTTKLKKAGKYLDIDIHDHIILSPDGKFFSFAQDGLM